MKRIFLAAALIAAIGTSAQTVNKKIALDKGQQIEQVNKVSALITQEMMGQTMEISMESNMTSLVEVKDRDANGFKLASTLKKMTMNMTAMGNEQKFDSDKPEDMNGPIGQGLKDKINVAKEYAVNKEGIVTAAQQNSATKADPNSIMGGMMNGAADEKEGAQFSALANLPATGVKVGQSWSDSTTDGDSKTINTYTLRSLSGNDGIVDVKSNLVINRELEQQGMTMQMAMSGNITGEYSFDVKTGVIKNRKMKTVASGTIDVMGQSVPLTLNSTLESTSALK